MKTYVTISRLGWIQLNTRVKAKRMVKRLKAHGIDFINELKRKAKQ